MTADDKTTWFDTLATLWRRLMSNKIVRVILWARWIITLAGLLATILWYAYVEGKNISGILSSDYSKVQAAQATLVDDSLTLQSNLLNNNVRVDLANEMIELRSLAMTTLGALGGLRAPTRTIVDAQTEFKTALQGLISVTNRLERGEIDDMAVALHNSLQAVSNTGGALNQAVRNFQGGMWPQLVGSIF